jgi:ADP-ribosylglycohydrolase
MNLYDRAIGCLFGQAIGDALGSFCEFDSSRKARYSVDKYIRTNGRLTMQGTFNNQLIELSTTDDTEMCLALARSLIRNRRYDVYDVTQSYVIWYHSDPIDVGGTTTRALDRTSLDFDSKNNYHIAKDCAQKRNFASLSNGCLMRASPLGIAGINLSSNELYHMGCMDCQLTNPHCIAQEAVYTYINCIKTSIETGQLERIITDIIGPMDAESPIKNIIVDAINTPSVEKIPMYESDRTKYVTTDSVHQGYLGITLYNAFYELTHTQNFTDIMRNIMSRGGDTDTNCAIAGALYGALNGYQGIPPYLLDQIIHSYKRKDVYPWGDTSDLAEVALLLTNVH